MWGVPEHTLKEEAKGTTDDFKTFGLAGGRMGGVLLKGKGESEVWGTSNLRYPLESPVGVVSRWTDAPVCSK